MEIAEEPPFQWQALLDSARTFAQASVDNYSVQDAAFFFLHAGASVELGVKAALCKASPVLLIEGGNRFSDHALISLMGFQVKSQSQAPHRALFTVGFDQAIKRLVTLHGNDVLGVPYDDVQALKAARDVTAHGGRVSEATAETLLKTLVTMTKVHASLAPLLDTNPEVFWGSSYALVRKASQEQKSHERHQVQTLLSAAKARFDRTYEGMDPDTRTEVLKQASDRVEPEDISSWYRTCPVCGATGLSVERPGKRRVSRREKAGVERGWMATNFTCKVCGLYLPSEELVKAVSTFEPWRPAEEGEIDLWYEDMGVNIDAADKKFLRAQGFYIE